MYANEFFRWLLLLAAILCLSFSMLVPGKLYGPIGWLLVVIMVSVYVI
jgi:hypothetical protein